MATYNDVNSLVYDSIQECIDVAKVCIESHKGNGGCYGMSALILLCAAIDAMGSFYNNNNFSQLNNNFKGIGKGDHFKEFYNAFKSIWEPEISEEDFCNNGDKSLVIAYRNRSMHNNGINQNFFISTEGDKLYINNEEKNEKILNITIMIQLVNNCFEKIKKEHPLESVSEEESTRGDNPSITGHTSHISSSYK